MQKYFLAKTDRQLGTCLRMLLAAGIADSELKVVENEKEKLEYHICIEADDATFATLKKRYETLIS